MIPNEHTAHVRDILDRGGIIMTPKGPLGPADVERLALSGMTRDDALSQLASQGNAEGD